MTLIKRSQFDKLFLKTVFKDIDIAAATYITKFFSTVMVLKLLLVDLENSNQVINQ